MANSPLSAVPSDKADAALDTSQTLDTLDTLDIAPNIDHLITEDDTPVDNLFSAKQQRLLVESLYASSAAWNRAERRFLADANIGLFFSVHDAPLVPDVFVSLDVQPHPDWHQKQHRSYFYWEFGKPPELAIEIVSNRKGGELTSKLDDYARMFVRYYVVFDPTQALKGELLQQFELSGKYVPMQDFWMEELGLGLRLWQGEYEGVQATWLRWCDERGNIVPTGAERAEQQRQRAEQQRQRAEQEFHRAERLAERLRERGINPDEL